MAIQTGAGATIAIGGSIYGSPNTTLAESLVEFKAITYTQIGEVEEIGEFGDERTIVPFISLADGRTRKARGSADAGDLQITFAYDAADAGQDALQTAFNVSSQNLDQYPFRVRLNDATGLGSPTNIGTTYYFGGKITQLRTQSITNDGIVKKVATIAINTAVFATDPT
jgi:hypothetical protein